MDMNHARTPMKWMLMQARGSNHIAVMLALTAAITALITAGSAYLLLGFVDIATGDSDAQFTHYVFYTAILLVALGIFIVISSALRAALQARIERKMRTNFLSAIFTRPLADIQKVHTGEVMMLLSEDISTVASFLPNMLRGLLGNIILFVAATTVLFLMNWQLALILFIAIPVMMVVMNLFAPFIQRISKTNKEDEERTRKYMQESISKLLLFKAYFMCKKVLANHADLYTQKHKSSVCMATLEGVSNFVNTVFGMGMFLIILGVGALFVMRGIVTVGVLVAMLSLVSNITQPFSVVSQYISQIAQGKASAERLQAVFVLPEEKISAPINGFEPVALTVENISFAYDGDDVLKGASLQANRNEIIGIIGESGSGKSTLSKIMMGLYPPKNGSVKLTAANGDTDASILSYVSYVPADNFIFNGTVKDNICMSEDVNNELLELAAKGANIHDVIINMPNGYDEYIGESSNLLSSGQAQRMGIARALYKDSPIIIFDEPTSNLDTDTIAALHATIKSISANKICIIVTHDEVTKSICDKVFTIKDGVI